MNLDQITTKCWILALFERDDGERLLLGDGWFDFKDSLQHFQPNTFANDVIELQGSDGQMLAGHVRRGAPQSFDGYIGDPITNRQTIEQHRREFLMFFRKRHHYKVVYIFPDGTAIQRKQGYITDAPSVPEIRQKFPEYHVALNFEDVNYYEYAENAQGEEIFSNIRDINISTAATGGLVWDNLGAVSDQMGWKDIATATGQMLTMTDPESIKAPIASFEMTGNTEQDGTPTPTAPVPIQTVTGRQTVKAMGKNLIEPIMPSWTYHGVLCTNNGDGSFTLNGTATATATWRISQSSANGHDNMLNLNGTYTLSCSGLQNGVNLIVTQLNVWQTVGAMRGNDTPATFTTNLDNLIVYVAVTNGTTVNNVTIRPMLEVGNQASAYEPYKGQNYEINLGKNLWNTTVENGGLDANGNTFVSTTQLRSIGYMEVEPNTEYSFSNTNNLVVDRICYYNGNKTFIERGVYLNVGTFTTPNNGCRYARLVIRATNGSNITPSSLVNPQIEKGARATSYSAYFAPIELCKIGTHQDRIFKESGKWWLHKEIGKVVLNGSEAWTYNGDDGSTSQFRLPTSIGAIATGENSIDAFVSHFTGDINGSTATAPCFWLNQQGLLRLRVYQSTAHSLADFKTWLGTALPSVYYVLATPTTTEITNEEVLEGLNSAAGLKLFPGQNNITDQTPNAQPTMTVQYYTALGPGGGLVWESGEAGGATIIEASGLDSAFPLWTVPGPSTNPTLTNITTGQSITWQGTVPAGQTLEIDMDKQTATLAGANVYAFVSGDWIRIDPGPNRMTYVGTGATQASTLSWNNIVG